jgi:hypothetical protein
VCLYHSPKLVAATARAETAERKLKAAREALRKVEIVPSIRPTSGHLYQCAWCNGSAETARTALIDQPTETSDD